MGNCKHCGNGAGFLRGVHGECQSAYEQGWGEMVAIAAEAAEDPQFSHAQLRLDLMDIAKRSFFDGEGINAAITEWWHRAVKASLSDGILTQQEESRLRDFRERLAIDEVLNEGTEMLEGAVRDRLMLDARLAALAIIDGQAHLDELGSSVQELGISDSDAKRLLAQAWEAAVDSTLEDGVLSLDEEASMVRYLNHFNLSVEDVDGNGAHHNMVKSATIRELTEGLVPERQNVSGHPFNLLKSEKLVWVFDVVDYIEAKTRRESRGTSQGVSIRVARGLYYRPSAFRSSIHEWEETVKSDTGLLGATTKHIYFHGPRKRFRVRLDKIVSYEPYGDGFGIMRDPSTAKPEMFVVGDGWFVYNLVTNLSSL